MSTKKNNHNHKKSGFEKSVKTVKKLEKSFEKDLKNTFKVKEEVPKQVEEKKEDKLTEQVQKHSVCTTCQATFGNKSIHELKSRGKTRVFQCSNCYGHSKNSPVIGVEKAKNEQGLTEIIL